MAKAARKRDARSLPSPQKRVFAFRFGWPLHKVPCKYVSGCGNVPAFMVEAAGVIYENIDSEGLFRKSGDLRRLSALRKRAERGQSLRGLDVHEVTSLVKTFFRLLPVPLVPNLFHDPLLRCLQMPEDSRGEALQDLCFSMPAPHLSCLRFFMHLLSCIADHARENRMTARNLAVVLTPSLVRLKIRSKLMNQEELRALPLQTALVEHLICHADLIGAMTSEMRQQSLYLAETMLAKKFSRKKWKRGNSGRSAEERVRVARAVLKLVADLHFRPSSSSSVSDASVVDAPPPTSWRCQSSARRGWHKHSRKKRGQEGEGNSSPSPLSGPQPRVRHVRMFSRRRNPGDSRLVQSSDLLTSWSRAIPVVYTSDKDKVVSACPDQSRETLISSVYSHPDLQESPCPSPCRETPAPRRRSCGTKSTARVNFRARVRTLPRETVATRVTVHADSGEAEREGNGYLALPTSFGPRSVALRAGKTQRVGMEHEQMTFGQGITSSGAFTVPPLRNERKASEQPTLRFSRNRFLIKEEKKEDQPSFRATADMSTLLTKEGKEDGKFTFRAEARPANPLRKEDGAAQPTTSRADRTNINTSSNPLLRGKEDDHSTSKEEVISVLLRDADSATTSSASLLREEGKEDNASTFRADIIGPCVPSPPFVHREEKEDGRPTSTADLGKSKVTGSCSGQLQESRVDQSSVLLNVSGASQTDTVGLFPRSESDSHQDICVTGDLQGASVDHPGHARAELVQTALGQPANESQTSGSSDTVLSSLKRGPESGDSEGEHAFLALREQEKNRDRIIRSNETGSELVLQPDDPADPVSRDEASLDEKKSQDTPGGEAIIYNSAAPDGSQQFAVHTPRPGMGTPGARHSNPCRVLEAASRNDLAPNVLEKTLEPAGGTQAVSGASPESGCSPPDWVGSTTMSDEHTSRSWFSISTISFSTDVSAPRTLSSRLTTTLGSAETSLTTMSGWRDDREQPASVSCGNPVTVQGPNDFRHDDTMNARHGDAMSARYDDAMNTRHCDAMGAKYADAMTAHHSDTINAQHSYAMNARYDDSTDARHGDAMSARYADTMNAQHSDMGARYGEAMNAQHSDATNTRYGDAMNARHDYALNIGHRDARNTMNSYALDARLGDAMNARHRDSKNIRYCDAMNAGHCDVMGVWHNDFMNTRHTHAMDVGHNDAINKRLGDTVKTRHIETMNNRHGDAMNARHSEGTNGKLDDAMNARHSEGTNGKLDDAMSTRHDNAMNIRYNDAVATTYSDGVNTRNSIGMNAEHSAGTSTNSNITMNTMSGDAKDARKGNTKHADARDNTNTWHSDAMNTRHADTTKTRIDCRKNRQIDVKNTECAGIMNASYSDAVKAIHIRDADALHGKHGDSMNTRHSDGMGTRRKDTTITRHNNTMDATHSDLMDAKQSDTMGARHNDTMDARHSDIMIAIYSNTLDAKQNDTMDARYNDTMGAMQSDSMDAKYSDAFDPRHIDALDARHSDAMNARYSEIIGPRDSDTMGARHSDTMDARDNGSVLPRQIDAMNTRYSAVAYARHNEKIDARHAQDLNTWHYDAMDARDSDVMNATHSDGRQCDAMNIWETDASVSGHNDVVDIWQTDEMDASDAMNARYNDVTNAGYNDVTNAGYNDAMSARYSDASYTMYSDVSERSSLSSSRDETSFPSARRLVQEQTATRMRESQVPRVHSPVQLGSRSKRSMLQADRRNTISGLHLKSGGMSSFSTTASPEHSHADYGYSPGLARYCQPELPARKTDSRAALRMSQSHQSDKRMPAGPAVSSHQFQPVLFDVPSHAQRNNLVLNRRRRLIGSLDNWALHEPSGHEQRKGMYEGDLTCDPYVMDRAWLDQRKERQCQSFKRSYPKDTVYPYIPLSVGRYSVERPSGALGVRPQDECYVPQAACPRPSHADLYYTPRWHKESWGQHFYTDAQGHYGAWAPFPGVSQTFPGVSQTFPIEQTQQLYPRQSQVDHEQHLYPRQASVDHECRSAGDSRTRHRRLMMRQYGHQLSVPPEPYRVLDPHLPFQPVFDGLRREHIGNPLCVGDGVLNLGKENEVGKEQDGIVEAQHEIGEGQPDISKEQARSPVSPEQAVSNVGMVAGPVTLQPREFHRHSVDEIEKMRLEIDAKLGKDSVWHVTDAKTRMEPTRHVTDVVDEEEVVDLQRQLELMHIGASSPNSETSPHQKVQLRAGEGHHRETRPTGDWGKRRPDAWRDFPPDYFSRPSSADDDASRPRSTSTSHSAQNEADVRAQVNYSPFTANERRNPASQSRLPRGDRSPSADASSGSICSSVGQEAGENFNPNRRPSFFSSRESVWVGSSLNSGTSRGLSARWSRDADVTAWNQSASFLEYRSPRLSSWRGGPRPGTSRGMRTADDSSPDFDM